MILLTALLSPALAATPWSIDTPLALATPGSSPDTAVVVGMEHYQDPRIPVVPFAKRDADVFAGYLVTTRGLDSTRVQRLDTANREDLLRALASARDEAKKRGGRVWVYFAGHGWRAIEERADRTPVVQQVLVLHDAPATLDGYVRRGLREQDVWSTLRGVRAEVVVDACFEGGSREGSLVDSGARYTTIDYDAIDPPEGVSAWRAVAPGQVALPFREAQHGVFTFLWLAGARGWADGTPTTPGAPAVTDGRVTAAENHAWMARVVGDDATQTPTWVGDGTIELSRGTAARPLEAGPGVEALRQWMPFLSRLEGQVGGDVDRWLTWQEELTGWFTLQDQELRAKAAASWGRAKRYLDSGAPAGRDGVVKFIEQYRGASLERDGVFSFVPIPELEDAWVALGRPADTGMRGYGDEMTLIPGGWYRMGSPPGEVGRDEDEAQHLVQVQSFELGRFEVSRGLFAGYRSAVNEEEYRLWGFPDEFMPAMKIDWCSAVSFANWMTTEWNEAHPVARRALAYSGVEECHLTHGRSVKRVANANGYRLPSEAEWELAARAGNQRAWRVDSIVYTGTSDRSEVCQYANVLSRATVSGIPDAGFECDDGVEGPAMCGGFKPNAWGIYDMTGNVWEWTDDGDDPLAGFDANGGAEGIGGTHSRGYHTARGGSFELHWADERVANRWPLQWADRAPATVGLRLARSLP